jgi:hypothetical protein
LKLIKILVNWKKKLKIPPITLDPQVKIRVFHYWKLKKFSSGDEPEDEGLEHEDEKQSEEGIFHHCFSAIYKKNISKLK